VLYAVVRGRRVNRPPRSIDHPSTTGRRAVDSPTVTDRPSLVHISFCRAFISDTSCVVTMSDQVSTLMHRTQTESCHSDGRNDRQLQFQGQAHSLGLFDLDLRLFDF